MALPYLLRTRPMVHANVQPPTAIAPTPMASYNKPRPQEGATNKTISFETPNYNFR